MFLAAGSLLLCASGLLIVAPAYAGTYRLVSTSPSPMATTNDEVRAGLCQSCCLRGRIFHKNVFQGTQLRPEPSWRSQFIDRQADGLPARHRWSRQEPSAFPG